MNRRLLRATYHVETLELNFTYGVPVYLKEALTGKSTSAARDYTHPYGSHYALMLAGSPGDGGVLTTSPLRLGVVKVVEMEATGVTAVGPVEIGIGLSGHPEASYQSMLVATPGDTGVPGAGRAALHVQDGPNSPLESAVLYADGSSTDIRDLDMGVLVDCESREVRGHISFSWVASGGTRFPAERVLVPTVRCTLLDGIREGEGEAAFQMRRLTVTLYS